MLISDSGIAEGLTFLINASASFQCISTFPNAEEALKQLPKNWPDVIIEIADSLSISVHTVRSHIRRIYEKLHVTSRTEATLKLSKKPLA